MIEIADVEVVIDDQDRVLPGAASEDRLDGLPELTCRRRLLDVADGPRQDGLRLLPRNGDEHDGHPSIATHQACERQPIHFRHEQVGDDEVRLPRFEYRERSATRQNRTHLVAEPFEQGTHPRHCVSIIVEEEKPSHRYSSNRPAGDRRRACRLHKSYPEPRTSFLTERIPDSASPTLDRNAAEIEAKTGTEPALSPP